MEIRNGDTVLVRLKVCDASPMEGTGVLYRDVEGKLCIVKRSDIVSVEPRPLQVGDKVTWGSGAAYFKIAAIHENDAFVTPISGGSYIPTRAYVHPLNDLRLAS